MTEPRLPIRGGNGRTSSMEVMFEPPAESRRRMEVSPLTLALVPGLLAMIVAALVAYGAVTTSDRTQDAAIARVEQRTNETAKAQQEQAVEQARLTERLEAAVQRLNDVAAKLERAADKR